MTVVGLDPTSVAQRTRPGDALPQIAARSPSLEGAVVGVIGNGLNRANELLAAVIDEIRRHHPIAGHISITKRGVSVPPDPADWERLTNGASVAITGFGGCGSCSSRSMRDAIELEAAGIPTVAVIHEGLHGAATAICRLGGVDDYAFATVPFPHPTIATWSDDEILEIARDVTPRVVELLTSSSPEV